MADVIATPNPARVGELYSLSGCGYDMAPVYVEINGEFAYAVGVRSTGGNCLDTNYSPAPGEPGEYTLTLRQQRRPRSRKRIVAETSLLVV